MLKAALLVNDTSNWYHYGCTATSIGIRESLEQLGYSVESLAITESYKLKQAPDNINKFDDRKTFQTFKESNTETLIKLKKSDYIIINGEGTLHGLKTVTTNLLYIAYIAKKYLKKHVSIINHSCYPSSQGTYDQHGAAELLYAKVYKSLDFIAVREPLSLRYLEKIGVNATLAFDCMPLTISRHYNIENIKPKRKIVLAGGVSFNRNMLEIYSTLIQALKDEGIPVEVLTGAAGNPAADDHNFIDLLSRHCPSGWKIVNAKSLSEWFNCIAEAQLLVSGRFHHTIAAICLGTPFITFESNTPKISGIFELLEQAPPLSSHDPDLLKKVFSLVDMRFSQRHEPRDILPELETLSRQNFNPF